MAELLYVNSSQLTKFIRADKFLLSMPLQHKFAKRYSQWYYNRSRDKRLIKSETLKKIQITED